MNDGMAALRETIEIAYGDKTFSITHSDPQDHIFNILKNTHTFYELDYLVALSRFVKPGDLVIDVGANIGNHTVFLAGVCQAKVIAFEPNKTTALLLRANVQANGLVKAVQIKGMALGASPGRGRLDVSRAAHNLGAVGITSEDRGNIRIKPLDRVKLPAQPKLIKIDAEGSDFSVLQGAEETISSSRAVVAIEASQRQDLLRIADLLDRHNYVLVGSHNYTPTHIFRPVERGEGGRLLRANALKLGLLYIDQASIRSQSDRQGRDLRKNVSTHEDLHQRLTSTEKEIVALKNDQSKAQSVANEQVGAQVASVKKSLTELHAAMQASAESGRQALMAQEQRLGETLSAQSKHLADAIGAFGSAQTAALQAASQRLDLQTASVQSSLADLRAMLDRSSEAWPQALLAQEARINEKFAAIVDQVASDVATLSSVQTDALHTASQRSEGQIALVQDGLADLRAKFDSSAQAWPEAWRAQEARASEKLSALVDQVSLITPSVLERLTPLTESFRTLRQEQVAAHGAQLHAIAELANRFASRLDALPTRDALRAEAHAFAKDIDGTLGVVRKHLEGVLDAILLEGTWLEGAFAALKQQQEEFRDQVVGRVQQQVSDQLEAHGRRLVSLLGEQTADLLAQIDARLAAFEREGRSRGRRGEDTDGLRRRSPEDLEEGAPDTDALRPLFMRAMDAKSRLQAPRRKGVLSNPRPDDSQPSRQGAAPVSGRAEEEPHQRPGVAEDTKGAPNEVVARLELRSSWDQLAWPRGSAQLGAGGVVTIEASSKASGIVTHWVDWSGGGPIEISISGDLLDCAGVAPVARLSNEADELIGPDFTLIPDRPLVMRVYAPHRTQRVRLCILVMKPTEGCKFKLQQIVFSRINADHYQKKVQDEIGQPVIASMASIPSRREMLRDAVTSLLLQCDSVRVFLNGYPEVPAFLNHPRIEIRRSQDWDDRGDAGKVFWLDKDVEQGYRLIVDDDLIFPPDFALRMCAKVSAYENKAIVATHGVLLRQPVHHYYSEDARAATFHFARYLGEDRTVHIGATNALCLHSSVVRMRWCDFMYCNSADIWLALFAHRNGIPIITPSRPEGWVRENRHAAPDSTIYHHSLRRTRTRFDSSLIQDAVLRHEAPLTMQLSKRPKIGLALFGNHTEASKSTLASWLSTRSLNVDWILFLSGLPDPTEHGERKDRANIEHEIHVIDSAGSIDEWLSLVRDLSDQLGVEIMLYCIGPISFRRSGWELPLLEHRSGSASASIHLISHGNGDSARVVNVTSQDLCCRAHGMISLPLGCEWKAGAGERFASFLALRQPEKELTSFALADLRGRIPTENSSGGLRIKSNRLDLLPGMGGGARSRTVNDFFERVLVLNLNRRPDRWRQMVRRLDRFGFRAQRFAAVDGMDVEVRAEYEAYAAMPIVRVSSELPSVKYSQDLYMHYPSQRARVAHLEAQSGRKAIASPGAWGYLKSYEQILEQALVDQVESLLVLDDDVVFHHQAPELFATLMDDVPKDWLILQLGSLQYNWSAPWVEWYSSNLYRNNGAAIGSHAVGMRFDVLPHLLDHIKRMEMPYDVGALSATVHSFAQRCFVAYPNIAIQSLADSDIGTSTFQKHKDLREIAETYRWRLDDYFDLPN